MRVLAEKNENPNLPHEQVSCTGAGFRSEGLGCGRLLEITPLDICTGTHHDYDGGTDTYYYIFCPVCNKKTEVFRNNFKLEFRMLM